jgi:peptide/nickel transport system substrate-binding protein
MTYRSADDRIDRLTSWLQEGRIDRRSFIRQATVLGVSGSMIATILAACGDDDDDDEDGGTTDGEPTATTGSAGGDATEAPEDEAATEPAEDGDATEAMDGDATEAEDGAATESGGGEATPAGEATQGGEIIIGTLGEAQSINPFLTNETEGTWRSNMLYDQFIYIDPETYEPKPKLAKEWTVSDDGLEYNFVLQENVMFSDGSPLTMNDISFFFHGVLEPESTSPFVPQFIEIEGAEDYNAGSADTISGVEVVDDLNLTVRLTQPNAAFIVNLENVRPVPAALLEGQDIATAEFFQAPIGAGPFVFESWQVGGDFVAVRNENYWQPGKPYLDRFVHRTIADSQTLVLSLETGEIHGSNYPAPTVAESLSAIETLEVVVPPFTQPDGWSFNLEHEALSIKEVRQGIAMAMNMEQFASDFLLGLGGVGVGPLAPDNWAFNPDLQPIPYDPERAGELFAEAGFADGFTFTATTNQGNILREDFLTFTQAALEPYGITVESGLTEWTQVVAAATDGTFEAICPTWSGAVVEPDDLYLTLHSESARNVYHYSNPEVDELLANAHVETDQEARKEMYYRVQEILMEDVPIFWAWYRPFIHVVDTRFAGWTDSNLTGGIFVGLENWYIKE